MIFASGAEFFCLSEKRGGFERLTKRRGRAIRRGIRRASLDRFGGIAAWGRSSPRARDSPLPQQHMMRIFHALGAGSARDRTLAAAESEGLYFY